MMVDTLLLARTSESHPLFADLSMVEILVEARTDDDDIIPVGTIGTVVGIIEDGKAYTIEFAHPDGALATLLPEQLKSAGLE